MPIAYDNRLLTDPYLLFSQDANEHSFLKHEKTPKCKFYACDYVNNRRFNQMYSGVNNVNSQSLTIKASISPEFEVFNNDKVLSLTDNKWWKITNVEVLDDGQMKYNSTKARQYLILTLVGD